jgi:hypothetical protein
MQTCNASNVCTVRTLIQLKHSLLITIRPSECAEDSINDDLVLQSVRQRSARGALAAVGVLAPVAHYDVDVEMSCKSQLSGRGGRQWHLLTGRSTGATTRECQKRCLRTAGGASMRRIRSVEQRGVVSRKEMICRCGSVTMRSGGGVLSHTGQQC